MILNEQDYLKLAVAVEFFPSLGKIVNKISPSATVCPCCRVDDFTHVEGCETAAKIAQIMMDEEKWDG